MRKKKPLTIERLEELANIPDNHFVGKEVGVLKNPDNGLRELVVLDGDHAEGAARGVRNLAKITLDWMKMEKVKR